MTRTGWCSGGTAAKCRTDRPLVSRRFGGDLGDVVRTMGRIQLATELKSEVVDDIVAFLHTPERQGPQDPLTAVPPAAMLLRRPAGKLSDCVPHSPRPPARAALAAASSAAWRSGSLTTGTA